MVPITLFNGKIMAEYTLAERKILLDTAHTSIKHGLAHHTPLDISVNNYTPHLQQIRGCFVTLHLNGQLRGCIGSLVAQQPLITNVAQNAFNSAFGDPRFPHLSATEFPNITLDISILSAPQPLAVTSEADLLQKLQPGIHGLILSDGGRRATFLPSVWEQLPNPTDFVIHLKNKAGWPSDYWSNSMHVETYTAELIA